MLPPDLTMGSYELQDLTDRGVGNLYEGRVIVDKTFGHAAYGCATCCGLGSSPWMYYDPIDVGLGYGTTQGVWDINFCSGGDTSVIEYILSSSWNTGNHAIATASRAVITGLAVGSTTNSASGTLTIGNINALRCPQAPVSPSGPANTTPAISSISPAQGLAGAAIGVTITGKGFASGATVSAGSNISVSNVSFSSSTQITPSPRQIRRRREETRPSR